MFGLFMPFNSLSLVMLARQSYSMPEAPWPLDMHLS